jgi:hypothetical protein
MGLICCFDETCYIHVFSLSSHLEVHNSAPTIREELGCILAEFVIEAQIMA